MSKSLGPTVPQAFLPQARDYLRRNGKTFHWASFFLPKEQAHFATLLYAGCRQLDDIADNHSTDKQDVRRELCTIQREIQHPGTECAHPVAALFVYLVRSRSMDSAAIVAFIDGLIMDTYAVALTSQAELDRYCYRVAGTVGIMMCSVLGVRDANAAAFAIDLGVAMQLTNISRDVLEDAGLGRRYLPVDVPIDSLTGAMASVMPMVSASIELQLERAERFYQSGIAGLSYLPRGSRVAIYLAAILYRAIGRKLRRDGCRWWAGRAVVSKRQKTLFTILALPVAGWLLIRGQRARLPHDSALHCYLDGLPHANT